MDAFPLVDVGIVLVGFVDAILQGLFYLLFIFLFLCFVECSSPRRALEFGCRMGVDVLRVL